jgi:hypothetical protein
VGRRVRKWGKRVHEEVGRRMRRWEVGGKEGEEVGRRMRGG